MPAKGTNDLERIAAALERIATVLEAGKPMTPRKARPKTKRQAPTPEEAIASAEAIAPPTSISEARADRALRKLGWVR